MAGRRTRVQFPLPAPEDEMEDFEERAQYALKIIREAGNNESLVAQWMQMWAS